MPKYCPECGEKIKGNPKFCQECGTNLLKEKSQDKKVKNERELHGKEKTLLPFEQYFKKCVIVIIFSMIFSLFAVILIFLNIPIQSRFEYFSQEPVLIQNAVLNWIFWSVIFFAIGLIVASWKKLKKRDFKVFVSSIFIAIIFLVSIVGLDLPLGQGKVRVVEYSKYSTIYSYSVNGTIENTWGASMFVDVGIVLYDVYGKSLDWHYEDITIPPHSTKTFYWKFLKDSDFNPLYVEKVQVKLTM